ncbi:MAG: leucyl aminopeptidase [Candidatus Nanopelagicales bacterium]|jgi:leucyl aminopeptidase|nr:leucyl aminopeptidase [Candidatus Nanopelagicales bacterium]
MTHPTLSLSTSLRGADLLVVGIATGPDGPLVAATPALSPEQQSALSVAATSIGATGKADEVLRLPGEAFGLPPLMTSGLGDLADAYPAETLRRAAGAALRAASSKAVAVALPTGDDPGRVEAAGLGAFVGAYRYPGKPAGGSPRPTPTKLTVLVGSTKGLKPAAARAQVIGEGIHLARRLVDTPPGALPPAALAAEAVAAAAGIGVEVEVLDEKALRTQGFGGILAVGQGSANPPRLVRMSYAPAGASAHLALVGKGITFDSGGLSLKPPTGMITMKCDMAGAAAVLAGVRAIALLEVPLRVTAYLAIAENMPSGSAQRPGDVITAYGGRTVEVLNTDAEGRLVMMDALVRCGADEPDAIIDVATLTGAQVVALGSRIAGIMGNDDGWRDEVHASAESAGELSWPMPIADELRPSLDSPVADLANIGERNGGMMTAAAFLREFVPEGVPWAHMDIAGPAFVDGAPWAYNGKGATGYGVRTLVSVAERLADQRS